MRTTNFPTLACKVLAVMGFTAGSLLLSGAPIIVSGMFPDANNPNALFEFEFSTSAAANLTIQTSSISPANGDGVQAVLWLFDSTGTTQLTKNDPPFDTEALINVAEPAGTYLLILSSFDQHYCLANSVCNNVVYGNTGWSYNGDFGDDSLAFSFSIDADQGTVTPVQNMFDAAPPRAIAIATPEPASFGLCAMGGCILLLYRRRARRS